MLRARRSRREEPLGLHVVDVLYDPERLAGLDLTVLDP
jgi:hypothetical protein